MSGKHWTSALAHALAIVCLVCLAGTIPAAVLFPAAVLPADASDSSLTTWASIIVFLFFLLVTLFVGWFLAWRRPRTALGWITLAIPVLFTVTTPLVLLGHVLIPTHPTAAGWVLLLSGGNGGDNTSWVPPVGLLLAQVPLRFPNGSLPSKRWRWFFWYTIAAIVVATVLGFTGDPDVGYGVANPLHVAWGDAEGLIVFVIFGLCLLPSFVGSLASLFVRYHRAGTIERAQLRWVFWAVATAIGVLTSEWVVGFAIPEDGPYGWIVRGWQGFGGVGYCLIPVAILVAVMRFGLYEIDRIISRTVSYTMVVLIVVALYAAVVTGLTTLIPNLPSIGVALATLGAAAVFLPLLRVVRRGVDRRFNRTAYDAQQVVEAFGQRLRTGADPHTAAADLAAAVDRALQPAALGVWTR